MSQINKRELLQKTVSLTLGGIIAGCLSSDQTSQQNRETRDKTNNQSNTSENQQEPKYKKTLSIEDIEEPKGLKAEVDAEIIQGLSKEHPPKIKITFTCVGKEPQYYKMNNPSPFSTEYVDSVNGSNRIEYADERRIDKSVENCWNYEPPGGGASYSKGVKLDPGETRSITRLILNDPKNNDCYPTGEYISKDRYSQIPASEWNEDIDELNGYEAGFKLIIKNDGS